jgi:hypothetical protein
MVNLSAGFFKPFVIILSIIILPGALGCCVLAFLDFRAELVVISAVLCIIYIASVFLTYRLSRKKEYYLSFADGALEICYPNIDKRGVLRLEADEVVKLEYYKLSSLKAWCMLHNCICPQCVFITYIKNGIQLCKHIGYARLESIEGFCRDADIALFVK